MAILRGKLRVHISAGVCLLFALLILSLPLTWLFAAAVAAVFHELCHTLAVWICNGDLQSIRIGRRGTQIQAEIFTPAKELLCVLAGPLGSLLLLPFARYIPRVAICAAAHSLYNLLPLPQLDGGRALNILLRMIFPRKAERIYRYFQMIFLGSLWILAGWLSVFLGFGVVPVLFALSLTVTAKKTLQTMTETGTIV